MGKTWLVRQLHAEVAAWGDVVPLRLAFDEASCPTTPSQSFDAFVQVVERLGEDLFGGSESQFGAFANELSRAEQERALMRVDADVRVKAGGADVGANARVGAVDVDLDTSGIEELLLGEKLRLVVGAFLPRYARLVKRRTALVTVDGYDTVAGSLLARWVLSLVAQLPNTLVVIVRSPAAAAPGVAGLTPERTRLEPFSRAEVGELLTCCLPGATVDPRLVDVVHGWSEGHAFTAGLAAKYLRTLAEPEPEIFEAHLAELPEEYTAQRVELALEIVRAPGVAELADEASAIAVTRRFDLDLFTALAAHEALPLTPAESVERLQEAGLVEPAGPRSYRVHSFIREPLEQRLAPAHRRQLHRRAADHYYARLTVDEPELHDSARAYDNWYRYEKPEWQSQLREWLYHNRSAAATDEERRRTRLQFTRVFLDAFWWWGCYLPFPFCPDLLADWRRMREDDDEWVDDLALLLEAYPMGHRKASAGNWADVRAALLGVRGSCGLDADADKLDGLDERHTRGLLDNFLAHSVRYREAADTRSYERALAYYEEAASLFERGDESWELAWTLFETAELHADFGDLARARAAWRDAAALALDEDDWELKANLHRLVADIRWQEGASQSAFDAHARAVLHAYLFQCKTPSQRPDAYTVTFYLEQVERVFERLSTLEGGALEDAVARLAGPFGGAPVAVTDVTAALASGEPSQLAGLVFPAAPADDELMEGSSAFTRRVNLLAEDLVSDPARDLGQVEP